MVRADPPVLGRLEGDADVGLVFHYLARDLVVSANGQVHRDRRISGHEAVQYTLHQPIHEPLASHQIQMATLHLLNALELLQKLLLLTVLAPQVGGDQLTRVG